jgi:carboxyl-terminal processing protease
VAGALTTMQLQATARSTVAQLPLEELQQLAAVFGMVKSDYVEPVDEKKLISDAIGGMVAGLDPHSQYFDKKSFKEFREATSGRFVGIGIEIGMETASSRSSADRRIARLPRRPEERRPRHQDRRHAGQGPHVDQAVKRMRGEPSTKVVLTVFRKSESRTFPVTIVREEISCRAFAPRWSSRATRGCASASSRIAPSTISRASSRSSTSRTQSEGPRARPPQRPGRPARRRGRHSRPLPAAGRRRRHDQRPDHRSKATFKASPEFYLRRGGSIR